MSENFKALIINQEGEKFTREIKSIDSKFLKHGDVLIKVAYSTLNYKDALVLKNGARLVKEFPHIPGIDLSGTVVESQNPNFKKDDEIELGEKIIIESIIGTTFSVKVDRALRYGKYNAIIPEINGEAYITGRNTFWLNPDDPLKDGFIIK